MSQSINAARKKEDAEHQVTRDSMVTMIETYRRVVFPRPMQKPPPMKLIVGNGMRMIVGNGEISLTRLVGHTQEQAHSIRDLMVGIVILHATNTIRYYAEAINRSQSLRLTDEMKALLRAMDDEAVTGEILIKAGASGCFKSIKDDYFYEPKDYVDT